MNKDAFYFPHFSNARNDRKLRRLRKELGIEGYGIYFMILETLRDQDGFTYPMEDIDLLSEEFGTSEQKLRTVISNYQLFEIDTSNSLFSVKFNEYLQPYIQMKEQRRLAGIASGESRRLKAEEKERVFNDRSTGDERELNENEQSKVKERKVNTNTSIMKMPENAPYLEFAELYLRGIKHMGKDNKNTKVIPSWIKDIKFMVEKEGRKLEDMENAARAYFNNYTVEFMPQCYSPSSFKEKYQSLVDQLNKIK